MLTIPTLITPRLHLRHFTLDDAPRLQFLVNDKRIAATHPVPHPYSLVDAETFLGKNIPEAGRTDGFHMAIILTESAALIGSTGCRIDLDNARASIGYWIGIPFWGNGYATEAAAALRDHLFQTLNLHRLTAVHFANNPASGRVMQKLGMTHEGTSRQHVRQGDTFIDDIHYGLLRTEWLAANRRIASS